MGFLGKLTAVVIQTALTPVAVVKDVITMGGVLTDHPGTYTVKSLKDVADTLDDAIDDLKR